MKKLIFAGWVIACLGLFVAGCSQHQQQSGQQMQMDSSGDMSPEKQRALMEADKMISDGERMKQDGLEMRAAGKDGADQMIQDGQRHMAQGEELKNKAAAMK